MILKCKFFIYYSKSLFFSRFLWVELKPTPFNKYCETSGTSSLLLLSPLCPFQVVTTTAYSLLSVLWANQAFLFQHSELSQAEMLFFLITGHFCNLSELKFAFQAFMEDLSKIPCPLLFTLVQVSGRLPSLKTGWESCGFWNHAAIAVRHLLPESSYHSSSE